MASNNNNPDDVEEFEVRHEYADDYRLLPATGIYGGRQPGGNMKIDFVLDDNPRIESEFVGVDDSGRVVGILDEWQENFARRTHQVGISMSPENAFHAGCWVIAEVLNNFHGIDVDPEEINDLVAGHYELDQSRGDV